MGLLALYLVDLPGPGIIAVSPASAGRWLTAEPPGGPNDRVFYYPLYQDFPSGSACKESACDEGGLSLIPGLGRSPGEGNPTPVFLPGESHGWRSLVGSFNSPRIAKSRTRLSNFTFTRHVISLSVLSIIALLFHR